MTTVHQHVSAIPRHQTQNNVIVGMDALSETLPASVVPLDGFGGERALADLLWSRLVDRSLSQSQTFNLSVGRELYINTFQS